jgi:hypothetical protein
MSKTKEFTSVKDFKEFDLNHIEKGTLYKEIEVDSPFDLSVNDFLNLEWLILSFGYYSNNKVALKFERTTNELFIGDMNNGGHTTKCRIIKIRREDIYDSSEKLIEWTKNHCFKMWMN